MTYANFMKELDVTPLVSPTENRQLFVNRQDSQAALTEYRQDTDALHNAQAPNLVITHEKPEHRIILLLKLRGLSNTEIAKNMGMTGPWVSQVTRQPWFQARLTELLHEAGQEIIEERIKVEANKSFDTLVELRDNPNAPAAVRANVAMNIIDRHLGKPTQRTENVSNIFHVSTKLEDLEEQLKEVEAAEKALLTRGTVAS